MTLALRALLECLECFFLATVDLLQTANRPQPCPFYCAKALPPNFSNRSFTLGIGFPSHAISGLIRTLPLGLAMTTIEVAHLELKTPSKVPLLTWSRSCCSTWSTNAYGTGLTLQKTGL